VDAGGQHPLEGDADCAAGAALAAIAHASAEAVRDVEGVRVEVTGRGVVAEEIRNLLGVEASLAAQTPLAIIETTGDPREISGALGRVATLGKVVLAGPAATRKLDLDLYPDVHRRSLTVLGVSPRPRLDDLVTRSRTISAQPATVQPGDDLPLDAMWFCLMCAD
jgi:hypothetical protein